MTDRPRFWKIRMAWRRFTCRRKGHIVDLTGIGIGVVKQGQCLRCDRLFAVSFVPYLPAFSAWTADLQLVCDEMDRLVELSRRGEIRE